MHHCSIPIMLVHGITPLHSKELPDFWIWTDDGVIVVAVVVDRLHGGIQEGVALMRAGVAGGRWRRRQGQWAVRCCGRSSAGSPEKLRKKNICQLLDPSSFYAKRPAKSCQSHKNGGDIYCQLFLCSHFLCQKAASTTSAYKFVSLITFWQT